MLTSLRPHFSCLMIMQHLVSRPLDYYRFLEIVYRRIIPITDSHLVAIKKIEGMRSWAEEYKEMLGKALVEYRQLLEFVRYQDVQNFESVDRKSTRLNSSH